MTESRRTRLTPAERREQLLDHGVRLLGARGMDELSIDVLAEEAQVSRGLLYHYFGTKHDFHVAVVERAARDIFERTAPVDEGSPAEVMTVAMRTYVAYVRDNHTGYVSLVNAARSGPADLRAVYDAARADLTDRIFAAAGPDTLAQLGIVDTPAARMIARAWATMAEDAVLAWVADPHDVDEERLLASLTGALWAGLAAVSQTG